MRNLSALRASCLAVVLVLGASAAHGVTINWVTVGDPGSPADVEVMVDGTSGCGSAPYTYRISKYEVTNAQYAEFLNTVAKTDTYGLYNENLGSGYGGITRSGNPGDYSYIAMTGRENNPVNYVSFFDSLRFVSWPDNG